MRAARLALAAATLTAALAGAPQSAAAQSQAQIAAQKDAQGVRLMGERKFAEASTRFKEAYARVPETRYVLHLCQSTLEEGKLGEATTACDAAEREEKQQPDPKLAAEIKKTRARIAAAKPPPPSKS